MRIVLLLLLLLCSQCQPRVRSERHRALLEWMEDNGKKKILCTTEAVADLVKAIGGEHIDVITLVWGQHDPHSYILVKGDDEKFDYADRIFYSGLHLEHGQSLFKKLHAHKKARSLGDYIAKKQGDKILRIDGSLDPHVWMDVFLWSQSIPFIVQELEILLPDHKEDIKKKGKKLQDDLERLDRAIKKKFQEVDERKRFLVSTHDAFNYFARAYLREEGEEEWLLRCQAPEGLSPEGRLSTADIDRLVQHIVDRQVRVVFAEKNINKDSLEKLVACCAKLNHRVRIASHELYADTLGEKSSGASTYRDMMWYNTETMTDEWKKDAE